MIARRFLGQTPRAPKWGRRTFATAGLLFLALLCSSLKLHSDVPHGHDDPAEETLIFADARHPGAPVHLEASNSATLLHCHTCLLQRDQVHGPLPPAKAAIAVLPTLAVVGVMAGAPRSHPQRHRSPRGPPVS